MNKLVITEYDGRLLEAVYMDGILSDLMLFEQGSLLGNIYVGKVERIVANIDAAFVNIGTGLPCYYSISENTPIYTDGKAHQTLKTGDEILVQVEKEAIKTKNPVATSCLTLKHECLLIDMSGRIGISSKIKDRERRDHLHTLAKRFLPADMGCILRTVCGQMSDEEIIPILRQMADKLADIVQIAKTRTCYSCIYQHEKEYIDYFLLKRSLALSEIVTDLEPCYHELRAYVGEHGHTEISVSLYQDSDVSLTICYNLKKELEALTYKRVWLKSGAYLVIEQTEAMVVIDVNTGKSTQGRRPTEEHFLKVNLEAAEEVCRQMRLRNLSGMIVVDFINMKTHGYMERVCRVIEDRLSLDPIPATFVDVTKLGLVELTRKKIRRSLLEKMD